MHPAKSVIIFTVTSGLGLGLLAIGALWLATGAWQPAYGDLILWLFTGLVALGIGLASSTLHLANPRNAVRAWMRYRTSWLSREAILAAAVVLAALLLALIGQGSMGRVVAVVLLLLSIATLYSTGMIYACLKTIRLWHTPLTPAYYIFAGCAAGSLAFVSMFGLGVGTTWLLLGVAAAIKVAWYVRAAQPSVIGLDAATGLRGGGVRLLEVGHTGETFLTREFGGQVGEQQLRGLRAGALLGTFLLPAIALLIGSSVLALLLLYAGQLVERWLFFAEAKHVVRLYHGQDV